MQAIDELTQRKRDELLEVICKLSDANTKAKRGIDLMERRASGTQLNVRQTMVGEEVQNTQASLKDLEELLTTLGTLYGVSRSGFLFLSESFVC